MVLGKGEKSTSALQYESHFGMDLGGAGAREWLVSLSWAECDLRTVKNRGQHSSTI